MARQYLWPWGGFAGEAGWVGALFSTVATPMRREVVVAREMHAEKAQASLNSGGSTEAACCSASSCAKLCTKCSPRSATCSMLKCTAEAQWVEWVQVVKIESCESKEAYCLLAFLACLLYPTRLPFLGLLLKRLWS